MKMPKPSHVFGATSIAVLCSVMMPADVPAQVSFSTDVQPIFTTNCVNRGCHPGGGAPFSLEEGVSYTNLVNVTASNQTCGAALRVTPFDSDSSVLYLRISGRTTCARMPLIGDTLSLADQNTIRDWIDEGAMNDITAIDDDGDQIPDKIALHQNYPNPFNPTTTISFSLPVASDVSLTILNLLGEEVASVASGHHSAGIHSVQWDATGHPSGVYFYKMQAGSYVETRRLVLLR
jgi:Secretion system C-terminal sorting domain